MTNMHVGEGSRNDIQEAGRAGALVRRGAHCYFQYLDRHGSVASRLCEAGVPAWVVHGERGDGGVTDDERRTLEACPRIRVITLPGASYFTPNEEPALVAKLVVEALGQVRSNEAEQRGEGARD